MFMIGQNSEKFPILPRQNRKLQAFPEMPRLFRKSLGISGNAGFQQISAICALARTFFLFDYFYVRPSDFLRSI